MQALRRRSDRAAPSCWRSGLDADLTAQIYLELMIGGLRQRGLGLGARPRSKPPKMKVRPAAPACGRKTPPLLPARKRKLALHAQPSSPKDLGENSLWAKYASTCWRTGQATPSQNGSNLRAEAGNLAGTAASQWPDKAPRNRSARSSRAACRHRARHRRRCGGRRGTT